MVPHKSASRGGGFPRTAADEGFLEHYFHASRLHHLSTWKLDLKARVRAELLALYGAASAGATETTTGETMSAAVGMGTAQVGEQMVLTAPPHRRTRQRMWTGPPIVVHIDMVRDASPRELGGEGRHVERPKGWCHVIIELWGR